MLRMVGWSLLAMGSGCVSESWVYSPTGEAVTRAPAGIDRIEGLAVLTYPTEHMPRREVSNALRLTASSSLDETVRLLFPGVERSEQRNPNNPGSMNMLNVYHDCGDPICEVEVPFEIVRSSAEEALIELTGDAILTVATPDRSLRRDRPGATLELELERY